MTENCGNCFYHLNQGEGQLVVCRESSPVPVSFNNGEVRAFFPHMDPVIGWCGKYERIVGSRFPHNDPIVVAAPKKNKGTRK